MSIPAAQRSESMQPLQHPAFHARCKRRREDDDHGHTLVNTKDAEAADAAQQMNWMNAGPTKGPRAVVPVLDAPCATDTVTGASSIWCRL